MHRIDLGIEQNRKYSCQYGKSYIVSDFVGEIISYISFNYIYLFIYFIIISLIWFIYHIIYPYIIYIYMKLGIPHSVLRFFFFFFCYLCFFFFLQFDFANEIWWNQESVLSVQKQRKSEKPNIVGQSLTVVFSVFCKSKISQLQHYWKYFVVGTGLCIVEYLTSTH